MKDVTPPRVGIVILSWNGANLLQSCLNSLVSQTETSFAICLVDNGSTDTTLEVFDKTPLSHKLLITNKKNKGYAPAVNQGVSLLLDTYTDLNYIVLLNNDVTLEKNWLKKMCDTMDAHKTIGFAQGENFTNETFSTYDATGIYIEEGMIPRQKTTIDTYPKVVGPNAAALILRRSFIKDVSYKGELLDSTFFAYVEDVDLLMRAFLYGWGHMLIKGAHAIHLGSATGNKVSYKKMYWGSRNLVWLTVKNIPSRVFVKKLKKIVISRLADIQYLSRIDKRLMLAYVRGMLVGILLSPAYLIKRRHIMKRRKKTDNDILDMLTPSNPPLTNPLKSLRKRTVR